MWPSVTKQWIYAEIPSMQSEVSKSYPIALSHWPIIGLSTTTSNLTVSINPSYLTPTSVQFRLNDKPTAGVGIYAVIIGTC